MDDPLGHLALREAADTLRAGGGDCDGADEAATVEALAVVQRFSYRGLAPPLALPSPQLVPFSGVVPPVVALACGGGCRSAAVAAAAAEVLWWLLRADDEVREAVVSAFDPAALPALLRGRGDGRALGLWVARIACEVAPHQRNAMLAAGVGPTLLGLASPGRGAHGGEGDRDAAREAKTTLRHMCMSRRVPPTAMQARAALPGLLQCARQPATVLGALRLAYSLLCSGGPARVQAALDAGAVGVVMDALRSGDADVVAAAWDLTRALATGSAAQLAVLLEAGVVPALCRTAGLADAKASGPALAMRRVSSVTADTEEEAAARAALLRSHTVPQLLTILADPAAEDGALLSLLPRRRRACPAHGAALCLLEAASDSGGGEVLREGGAIPALADFLSSRRRATDRTARVSLDALRLLCGVHPPADVATLRAALPALVRLHASAGVPVPEMALWGAAALLGTAQGDDGAETRVQAALDAGLARVAVAALGGGGKGGEAWAAAHLMACLANGSQQQLQDVLAAGAVPALCRAAGEDGAATSEATAAAVLLVKRAAAQGSEGDALLQLMQAVEGGGGRRRGWRLALLSKDPKRRCQGALRVLRELAAPGSPCRAVLRAPRVLDTLAQVTGSPDYEWQARDEANVVLRRLNE